MTLSTSIIEDLKFLTSINPETHSLALKNSKVILCKKRSKAANFFWHIIHIITFTLVPINPSLNEVTRHILRQTAVLNFNAIIDDDEKKLLSRSFRHLRVFIKNQSGGNIENITSLYKVVQKITTVDRSLKFLISKFYLSKDWTEEAKNTSTTFIMKSLETERSKDVYELAVEYLLERKENRHLIHQFFECFLSEKVDIQDQLNFLEKVPLELIEILDLSENNLFKTKLNLLLVQAISKPHFDILLNKTRIQESIVESLKMLISTKTFDFNELIFLINLSIQENVFYKVLSNLISKDLNLFCEIVNALSLNNTLFSKSTLDNIATFLLKSYKEDAILSLLKITPYNFLKNHLIVSLHIPSKEMILEMILSLRQDDAKNYIPHLENQNIDSISINRIKEKFESDYKKM